MNKFNIFKKASLAVALTVAGLMVSMAPVSAIVYNGDETVANPTPAFDVFTGVPTYGNESDFFRGRVPVGGNVNDVSTLYTDPVNGGSCDNGTVMQLRVYVHNGATATGNANGAGPSVIHGAQVRVDLANSQHPTAVLSASNAGTISDQVAINCSGQPVTLNYVPGSAHQFAKGTLQVPVSDSIVTSGASIRSQATPGDVWGCWDDRIYVVLSVQVSKTTPTTPTPTTPTPPTTPAPTKPVPPTTLVNTGPGSTLAMFAAVTAAGAVAYRYFLGRRLSRQ